MTDTPTTSRTRPRGGRPEGPRPPRRRPAPVTLDVPPAWLSHVPDRLLRDVPHPDPERGLLAHLREQGIFARPTLAQVEGERARRGLRRLGVGEVTAPPRPAVLPMLGGRSDVREEGSRNRTRIEEPLGDLAGDAPGVYALGFEVTRGARDERAA